MIYAFPHLVSSTYSTDTYLHTFKKDGVRVLIAFGIGLMNSISLEKDIRSNYKFHKLHTLNSCLEFNEFSSLVR